MEPGLFKKGNGQEAAVAAAAAGNLPQFGAEQKRLIAAAREQLHARVGQIALALAVEPRYRHQTLADLQALVLEPLLRSRIAIAMAGGKDEDPVGAATAGIAFWASVSDEVDAKIREQIKAGVFPVRLKPQEWASGDKAWLLDVIAPSRKLASMVLANFRQVVKEGDLRVHPMAARMVEPAVLQEIARRTGAAHDGSN
jgi:cytolysin-activating lysine-acyltransferase